MTRLQISVVALCPVIMFLGIALYWSRKASALPTIDLRRFLDKRKPIDGTPLDPKWIERVRALSTSATTDSLIAPDLARAIADDLLQGDNWDAAGWMTDVDGDGSLDLVLKRYWTGTGVMFELLVCLNCQRQPTCYRFRGGERGGTYYGPDAIIPVQDHVLALRNNRSKIVVVPECLIDRGAATVLNWPTLYEFHQGRFDIVDRHYRSFYEERVLPKLPTLREEPEAGDVRAIQEQVGRLYP